MSKKHTHDDGSFHSFVNGAVFGAIAGVVLGVLFAPTSGVESRKKLKEVSDDAAEKFDEVKIAAEPLIAEIEQKVAPVMQKVKEAEGPIKSEVLERVAQLVEEVDVMTDGAVTEKKEKLQSTKAKFFKNTKKSESDPSQENA
ncbi:MAG: YtxH domain-containing protein [Patescibacteria group bacterium]